MPIEYTASPWVYCVGNKADGREYCFFGDFTSGYVYQDNVGTSHDGAAYTSFLRLPFNHCGSPQYRKRFRRAILDMVADTYGEINVSYDLSANDPTGTELGATTTLEVLGEGGYWDQFTWDQFTWDAPVVSQPAVKLDGTEKSISLLFYTNSAEFGSHALQGLHLNFTVRRIER
jgi:hypothetical protein